jgi:hypothetical protein
MTISSTTRRSGPFEGNSAATAFPFAFKVFDKTNIAVTISDSVDNETLLVLDSDYSVALNADQNGSPGGTITYPITGAPMDAQHVVVIVGNLAELQPTQLTNNGGFYPATIENALDRAVILIQQLSEIVARAITVPVADNITAHPLPGNSARSLRALIFDADGNPTVSVDPYAESATTLAEAEAYTNTAIAAATPGIEAAAVATAGTNAANQIVAAAPGIEATAVGIANVNAASMIAALQTPTFQAYNSTVLVNGADFTAGTSNSVTIPATSAAKVIAGVFMDGVYQGRTQWTLDPTGTIVGFNGVIPAGTAEIDVMYFSPGLMGSFIQAGIGSVPRSYQDRQQDSITTFDFMTDAQKMNVYLRLGTIDVTEAVRDAVAYAATTKKKLLAPAGYYLLDGVNPITATSPVSLVGDGKYNTIFTTNNLAGQMFSFSGPYVLLEDFGMQVNAKGATTAALLHIFCETENVNRVMFNNYGLAIKAGGNVGSYTDCDWLDVGSTSSVGVEVNGYAGGFNMYNGFWYVPTLTPTAGMHIIACGGMLLQGTNIIRQGTNILVTPGAGQQADSIQIVNSFIDSAQNAAIFVQPTGGGIVTRMYLCQTECDSSAGNGMLFDASNGQILGLCIVSLQAMGCTNNGLELNGAGLRDVDIIGGTACGNGGSGISMTNGVTGVRIRGVFAGQGYGELPNDIGIFTDGTCTGVVIDGCDVNGNTSAGIGGPLAGVTIINTSGFVSVNAGQASITPGATTVTVLHGLGDTPEPQNIILTGFTSQIFSLNSGAITSTTFQVEIPTAIGGTAQFGWRASCNGQF